MQKEITLTADGTAMHNGKKLTFRTVAGFTAYCERVGVKAMLKGIKSTSPLFGR